MHLLEFSPVILVLSVCTSFAAAGNVCTDRIGAVNGPLMFRHTWQVALPREVGTHSDFMYLSVCEPLSFPASSPGAPCNGKSVCRVTDGRAEVLADLSVNASNVEMTDSWMFLKGNKCGEGHPQDFKMSIRLSCASHLGSPEYFIDRKCQVFFLWRTSAACPKEPARTEVPCSAYTYSGSHHDLTGLIKTTGGYTVEATDPSTRLVINVCSDMQPAEEMAYPPRSGACLLNDKKECKSVGQLQSGLLANDTGLYLEYAPGPESQPRPGCTELPKTVVQFRCPGRGRSRAPRLISDVNCHYYIEWETQYACSLDLLQTSPKSCKFTSEVHGVDLDLGPLQLENGYRTTEMTINGTKAVLYYNICGKSLGSGPAKCGTKKSSKSAICAEIGGHTLSLGHEEEQTLQFVDDVVTMRFTDGSECPSSPGSPWSSNIHFVCNKEQGAGQLQFGLLDKDACTYYFIWETAHACPKPREEDCVIEQGGVRIDLRPLSRSGGETPWTALGNLPSDMESSILINVCEGLDKTTVGKDCGLGSTVCVKRSNGKSAVYGMEPSRLQYDMQTRTALLFFEGSLCWNGKKYRSVINFICKPGAVSTSPQVVREVESECLLELEWHSAVACPQAAYVGQDCRVYDDALGFELNLNPLKSSKPYEVKHGGYSFFLNVCGAADGTPCSAGSSSANAAVCQVSISSGRFWSLGQASSKLTYVDGMLNLTYTGGTPYNDPGKTPRSSMLTFLCDYEAGIGQPQFLDEANRTYAFAWYTSYACPPSSFVGCVYRDPHTNMSYDLARLNQVNPGGNWIAQQDEVDHSVVAFLSICRPLRHPFPGCSSNAAVCIMHSYHNGTTKVVVGNAGQARHAPQNISQHLSLHYDQGDPCPFKKHTNYSTLINFICDPNQEEHLLYINPERNQCEQRFLWVTHMACPVSHLDARDSCALTTSQGTTYSLSALHLPGSFYTIVSAAGLTYELNVCGPVHGGHCASMSNTSVCVVKGGVGKQLARTNGMSLSSEDPGSLRLTYVGNYTNHSAEAFKVVVDVTCEEGTNGHHFSLLRAEPKLVVFGVSTPLACEPEPAKCIFDDVYGYQYDLTPLQLRSGNWEVYHSKSNRHFHLSFCQPLNPSPSYSCPPGVAVCETDTLHPSHLGVSWGGTYRAPMVTDKSTLLLQYPNGAPCANGQRARRTLISLICSDEQVGPRYLAESEDCELLFDFQTPAACPLKMAKGADCVVQDPRYGYVYNMSLLKNASGDYEVYAPGFTYLINICQPLKTGAAGCAGAAVCQTKPHDAQFSVDAGKPNSTLIYRNGLVTLTYAEGAGGCKGSFNRTSIITFVCDHSTIGWEGPEFVSESEDCTYTFVWRTTLACPPVVKSECSVSLGDAGIVDLSPLSDPRENYVIKTPTGTKYVINVCRSVIYSAGSACVKSAGACAVLKPHITQNIGQVQSPPVFEDGIVKIRYAAGDICNRRSSRSAPVRMQTVIEFECDHNIKAGYPILLREEGCTYYFQWRTVYACPMAEESVYDNCTVLHPLTNEEFDLSVLKSSLPVNVTDNGDTYFMSVCGPLPDNLCGPGAGMCLKQNSSNNLVSLGKANKKVHFRDGVMFVKYQDGDVCFDPSSSAARRSSVIQFVCASAGRSHLGPELLHVDNGCTYYFAWYTERACRRVLHCVVDEGTEQYDLSPLIKSTGRHTVLNLRDPGYTYYINVCQPVHAVAPYHMLVNAGLIRLSKTTSSVESLGEVFMEPFNDFEGHVTLLYVNGSQCAYNASISNKARVIFVCDPSTTVEEPVLLDIDKDNCLYIFEWRTNLVCPEVNRKVVPGEQCVFSIPQHGLNFDLSGLKRNNSTLFEVAEPNGNRKFMLDICGRTKLSGSGCGSGSVCLVSADAESNYGMLSSFTYIQSGLKVMYTNGSTCTESEGVAHSAEVSFECDEDAGIGRPVLDHKHACHATFIWKTSLVCVADHRQCVLTSGDDMYDFGLLASVSHVRNVTDEQGNIYWLNVCSDMNADHQSVQSCPSSAAVCMRSKGHSGHDFTIGKAQSLTLSAVAPGRVDMTYGGGDPYVCHNRTSQHPTTLIQHECVTGGSSTGVLEFVMGPTPDQCLFVFRWKSRTACPVVEDVAIPEKDGILVEKRLNLAMNLSSVLSSTFNVSEQRGKDGYVYMVRLGAPVAAGIAGACVEASVCQTKGSASFYRDVGSYSTKKFVVRGSELLLEMESLGSKCGRTSKAVKSIISFECSRTAGLGSPEFLYESGKCHYLFRWATAHVCHDALIRIAGPGSDRLVGPASASSSATVGIVTAAVIVFVLASAGLYLMRNKLRTLLDLTCYKSLGAIRIPQYHYSKTTSQLRSTDENGDTELLTSGSSMNSGDDPTDPHILT